LLKVFSKVFHQTLEVFSTAQVFFLPICGEVSSNKKESKFKGTMLSSVINGIFLDIESFVS